LSHAAVDEQLDAGDIAAVIRRKEYHRLGDLIGRACAAQRRGRGGLRLDLFDLLVAQTQRVRVTGRDDRARADDVDADLAVL
jgi:hypothetical protein